MRFAPYANRFLSGIKPGGLGSQRIRTMFVASLSGGTAARFAPKKSPMRISFSPGIILTYSSSSSRFFSAARSFSNSGMGSGREK